MANSSLQRSRTAGSTKTKFTISMWVKKSANNAKYLLVNYTDDSNRGLIQFGGSDEFLFQSKYSNSNNAVLQTNRKFRDTSAWYNFVLIGDSTLATAGDRLKLYVNGVRETSFASETQISQDGNFYLNEATTNGFRIGEKGDGSDYFDGYISHFVFLDGVAAAYTEFGETDSTSGIWKFKSPSGVTWGTNGFHLKFENSAALGTDSSGQSNTFAVNGNLKQALDTPSNVFNTLNPLVPIPSGFSITQGNLSFAASTGQWQGNVTTLAPTQGKWYYECKYTTGVGIKLDIMRQSANDLRHMADNNTSYGAYSSDGYGYQQNNSGTDYYCSNNSCTTWNSSRGNATRIYMVCIDLDNGKYWIGADGTWYNKTGTANPATGADPLHSFSAKLNGDPFYITLSAEVAGSTHHANFGNGYYGTTAVATNSGNGYSDANSQGKFSYQPPSGYYALNTKNLNTYG